jgi:hypothetical protein
MLYPLAVTAKLKELKPKSEDPHHQMRARAVRLLKVEPLQASASKTHAFLRRKE